MLRPALGFARFRAVTRAQRYMLSPDHEELSTINGMLTDGSHARVIANTILADRA